MEILYDISSLNYAICTTFRFSQVFLNKLQQNVHRAQTFCVSTPGGRLLVMMVVMFLLAMVIVVAATRMLAMVSIAFVMPMVVMATATCVIVFFVVVLVVLVSVTMAVVMVTAAGMVLSGVTLCLGASLPLLLQFHGHMVDTMRLQFPANCCLQGSRFADRKSTRLNTSHD